MGITLRDVLRHHLAPAEPLVLTAHESLDQDVRWVHSSEIFEIGPLLSGGELLLTTGLGLAGVDAGTRRHYIRDLADRGVAALAVELGRTFETMPAELTQAASAARLPLIALQSVVPFIDLCRTANTAIISGEVAGLRMRADLDRELHTALVAGSSTPAVLARVADALRCPVILVGHSGALVAAHGVDDDHSAWAAVDASTASVPVHARGTIVATLIAGPGSTLPTRELVAALDVAAGPVAVTLTSAGSLGGLPHRTAASLVSDLLDGRVDRHADLVSRCAAAGFRPAGRVRIVPIAVDAPTTRLASRMIGAAARTLGSTTLHAEVHATTYGLIAVPAAGDDPVASIVDALHTTRTGENSAATVVVGDPVRFDSRLLGNALDRVRRTLDVAVALRRSGTVGPEGSVTSARALAGDLTVAGLDPTARRVLVDSALAPVAAWDRDHGSELVRTLEVHLRNGCSATRCAAALHLGRQSLYQRLDRIRSLLGFDWDAETYPTLLLAAIAHRLELADAVG
ncbi:helix-turn-helix domain-containing protein [Rhodococcus gannanensis]|uniref:PucR family transcriptional regulator ligand-binding domain-containing protein n=1 Tax=Rhodococcus gannanensis TaxID=1960308 RepID=A0ABW4P9V0_9NOCA